MLYHPPPLDALDQASIEEWRERTTYIQEDLQWLLRLPHDKFWCQVYAACNLTACQENYALQGSYNVGALGQVVILDLALYKFGIFIYLFIDNIGLPVECVVVAMLLYC